MSYPKLKIKPNRVSLDISESLTLSTWYHEQGDDEAEKDCFTIDTPGPLQFVKIKDIPLIIEFLREVKRLHEKENK